VRARRYRPVQGARRPRTYHYRRRSRRHRPVRLSARRHRHRSHRRRQCHADRGLTRQASNPCITRHLGVKCRRLRRNAMRGIVALLGLCAAIGAPMARAQDGQIVGQWTRPDGFRQTTLISHNAALSFAVPGDWKVLRFDFKLPVATAVYEVPDPSTLEGSSNTNCSMAFADPATTDGQALVARVLAFGGGDGQRDGWALHTRTDTADTASTVETVAIRAQGQV